MGGASKVTLVSSRTMEHYLDQSARNGSIVLQAIAPLVDGARHNRLEVIEETLSKVLHWDPVLGYALRTFVVDPVP